MILRTEKSAALDIQNVNSSLTCTLLLICITLILLEVFVLCLHINVLCITILELSGAFGHAFRNLLGKLFPNQMAFVLNLLIPN